MHEEMCIISIIVTDVSKAFPGHNINYVMP